VLAAATAIAVAALAPVTVTATSGSVTAAMTATGAASEATITDATGIRITIERAGVPVFNGPLRPCRFGCSDDDPTGAAFSAIGARDLDGDGEPEVLVDRSDGFTPCCTFETAILRLNPTLGTYTELDRHWGETYRIADLDGDGRPEFLTADQRFYQRFAPRVFGFQLPVKILQLRGPALVDVTREHPARIRRHTQSLTRLLHSTEKIADGRTPGDRVAARLGLRPQLAAYAAEERMLGRRAVGDRRLASEVGHGRVSAGFRRALLRFLARLGYV
jgi:hypothetical protein